MRKIILGLIAMILIACTSPLKENGPRICPSDDFNFSSSDLEVKKVKPNGSLFDETTFVSGSELDFEAGEGLHILADFGEYVELELTISSTVSSNRKFIKTKTNKIDFYWYGNTDNYPFFGAEKCEITLRIPCQQLVKYTFNTKGNANFKKTHPNFGFLIRDFQGNGVYPVSTTGPVNDAGNGWFDGNVTFSYETDNPSPMGGKYLRMKRTVVNAAWYLGGHSFPVNTATKKFQDILKITNPDSIFINFFIRAELPNTNMEIGLQNPKLKGTPTPTHLVSGNVNWKGWKLISRSFSNMSVSSGPHAGKTITESDVLSLSNMVLQLGASPQQTNELQYDYDFIFISFGSPLAN